MSKLYVFGIGGTGSRVLKSLTMLLASGMEIETDEIVPVIIDSDVSLGNLTDTVDLMRKYNQIREKLSFTNDSKNRFFRTAINLDILPSKSPVVPLNTNGETFENYMGCASMDDANKALMYMLFSQANLASDMENGFKGNPNIGSVVLNQFERLREYKAIIGSMAQGDRIFVVSSIFGGTGASGFPLLVKNLRANSNLSGFNIARNAPIGAVTVMPYFSLKQDDKSKIDSSTFISKTRAALKYYARNLTETNVLYYIGDDMTKQYENHEGGVYQKNDAHFIEFASALSIIDFMSMRDRDMVVNDGVVQNHIYKEYGLNGESENLIFGDLCNFSDGMKSMSQFTLFYMFLNEELTSSRSQKQPWVKTFEVSDNFIRSDFYKGLKGFLEEYAKWLKEMGNNRRAFSPFTLDISRDSLFNYVKGFSPVRVCSMHSNYALIEEWLNREKLYRNMGQEQRFVELFYNTTKKAVENKLKM